MINKPSITISKFKNKQLITKTIPINIFHKNVIEKFFNKVNYNNFNEIETNYVLKDIINKNIQTIHFKNYIFKNNTAFLNLIKFNGKIILENCTFEGSLHLTEEDFYNRYLTPRPEKHCCNIEIINPKINNKLSISCAKDVILSLDDTSKFTLEINYVDAITINANNTNSLNYLRIFSNNEIVINDMFYKLDDIGNKIVANYLYLNNTSLEIGAFTYNELKVNRLKMNSSSIISEIDLNLKYLVLKNSSVIGKEDITIPNICCIKIEDDNKEDILDTSSYIEASKNLYIGNKQYTSSNNAPILIDEKKLNKIYPKYLVEKLGKQPTKWILLNNVLPKEEIIDNVIQYNENTIVHIKNFNFSNNKHINITSSKKRILILEDCTFNGITINAKNVDMKLINPTFTYNKNFIIESANEVTIKSNNETENKFNLTIKNSKTVSIIKSKNINIVNLITGVSYIDDCDSLIINNLKSNIFISSNSEIKILIQEISVKALNIENSTIVNDKTFLAINDLEIITTTNSTIKTNNLMLEKIPKIETIDSYIETYSIKIGNLFIDVNDSINLLDLTNNEIELTKKRAYLTYLFKKINDKTNEQISSIMNKEENKIKQKLLIKKEILNNKKLKEL